DGHNSHHMHALMEYPRAHRMLVLHHFTHVYQALDVMIFSILKRCWSESRD
ncbi:hypothetical protein B0H13DRAFT_1465673, partial [Mycena leptocephala]